MFKNLYFLLFLFWMNLIIAQNKTTKDLSSYNIGHSHTIDGFASNMADSLMQHGCRNLVAVNNDLQTFVFIHNSIVLTPEKDSIYSKTIQIDYSVNEGYDWIINENIFDPDDSLLGYNFNYPQLRLWNPAGNTNPDNMFIISSFIMSHDSMGRLNEMGFATRTLGNQYLSKTILPQIDGNYDSWGIKDNLTIKKNNGEIWMADEYKELDFNSTAVSDSIACIKGIFQPATHNWNFSQFTLPFKLTNKNHAQQVGYFPKNTNPSNLKIKFSENGNDGYISTIAHNDSCFQTFSPFELSPIIIKTTDGGITWSETRGINKKLNDFFAVRYMVPNDFLTDSLGIPADSIDYYRTHVLKYTCIPSEHDMAVDAEGNIHLLTYVALLFADSINQLVPRLNSWKCGGLVHFTADYDCENWRAYLINKPKQFNGKFKNFIEGIRSQIAINNQFILFKWLTNSTDTATNNSNPDLFVKASDNYTQSSTTDLNITYLSDFENYALMSTVAEDFIAENFNYISVNFNFVCMSAYNPNFIDYHAIYAGFAETLHHPIIGFCNRINLNTIGISAINLPFGGNKAWLKITDTQQNIDTSFEISLTGGIYNLPCNYNFSTSLFLLNEFGHEYPMTCWVGIPEQEEKNQAINIYPNPATSHFTININQANINDAIIEVTNVLGSTVYATTVKQNQIKIPVHQWPAGIYMVQLKRGNVVLEQEKLVIQK